MAENQFLNTSSNVTTYATKLTEMPGDSSVIFICIICICYQICFCIMLTIACSQRLIEQEDFVLLVIVITLMVLFNVTLTLHASTNIPGIAYSLAIDYCISSIGMYCHYCLLIYCYKSCGGEKELLAKLCDKSTSLFTKSFHRKLKLAVLQFCITKIMCGSFVILLKLMGLYEDEHWGMQNLYCYIVIISSFSTMCAVYALATFLSIAEKYLKPMTTVFIAVMLFIYCQGAMLAVLECDGVIVSSTDEAGVALVGAASVIWQYLLVSVELTALVFALRFLVPLPDNEDFATDQVGTVTDDSTIVLESVM